MNKFSIIIPTYNRGNRIKKTIESVMSQLYDDFEIIVIDDGSTDNTEEVIKSIPSKRLVYFKQENKERGAARNMGIKSASGEYITFVDSDDILYDNYLSNADNIINKFNSPPFLHLPYEIINEEGKVMHKVYVPADNPEVFIKGNPLSCLGVFIRRDIALAYQFNEDRAIAGSEDWELWIRLACRYGLKTSDNISAALVLHKDRSVMSGDVDMLIKRKYLSVEYAFKDECVQKRFSKYKMQVLSYAETYISLHATLNRNYKIGIKYLKKAAFRYLPSIFQKRTLAIIKHLIMS